MAHFEVIVLLRDDDRMTKSDIWQKVSDVLGPFQEWNAEGPRHLDWWRPGDNSDTTLMIGSYDPEADELNWEICPHCWGTGRIEDAGSGEDCAWCKGDGSRTKWRKISDAIVAVPIVRADFYAAVIITPLGEWIEPNDTMGSLGPINYPWLAEFQQLLKGYRDCLAVLVHCHC